MAEFEPALENWAVDILFFNKPWFDHLVKLDAEEGDAAFAASRLMNKLYQMGWQKLSRIREANTSLMRFFSPSTRSKPDMHLVESSHALTVAIADVIYGRSLAYIVDRDGNEVAPSRAICETLLGPFMDDPIAISPAYLGTNNQVGYLPLDYISPNIVSRAGAKFTTANQSTRDRIVAIFEKIRNASNLIVEEQVKFPLLENLDEFLESIAFRVPSTYSGSKSIERASSEFKFCLEDSRTQTRSLRDAELDEATFFQPYLERLENQRCDFFRACARIRAFRPGL